MSEFTRTVGVLVVVLIAGVLISAGVDEDSAFVGFGRVLVAGGIVGLLWLLIRKPSTDAD